MIGIERIMVKPNPHRLTRPEIDAYHARA